MFRFSAEGYATAGALRCMLGQADPAFVHGSDGLVFYGGLPQISRDVKQCIRASQTFAHIPFSRSGNQIAASSVMATRDITRGSRTSRQRACTLAESGILTSRE